MDIDEAIPAEHCKAVAQIISYVLRITGKTRR
jgi:type III secretion system FlhB-like substrate exporter